VAVQGRRFRACSPARVLAELRELTQRYRPRRIVFRDPAFAHDRERVVRICRGILADPALRPGRTLKWECESRPEHFDRELLRLMSLAGCISVKVGLETTDAAVLTRQGRVAGSDQAASYLARVSELVRACARWGIACRLFALAGLPGQTLAAAQETARFAHALRPTSFTVSALRHYPGLQFTDAACPSAEETCAQWEVLFRAQQSLERAGVQQGPRWEGAVRRFVARLANLRRRAG